METLPKNVWKRLSELFPANPDAAAAAADLFREYEADGYLDRPAGELLQIELSVIADFFRRVVLMHSRESPILRRRDTRWMSEFDYTLVNIRGAGVGKQLGNFLRASLFITTLRTKAIILSPVTRGSSDNLENLESHAVLRNELANAQAQDAGIGPEVQLTAFCEAAHLLGFVIGFDLDYRVDPLAAVVLHKPELFFWTQGGNFIADETKQNELRDTVRERIALGRKAGAAMDRELVKSALALSSIAPKPSMDGSGRTALAFRKLGKGVPHEPREAAVNYWSRVFDLWRDRYGFDFLVLRGTRSEAGKDEETPDLSLVRNAADAARKGGVRRNIGVIAEGHPAEVESFGHQGVDLVLANDAEHKADRHWFQSAFELDDILRRVNLGRKLRFSVPLELNPGEKESLSRQERALIKRFTARFLGTGPSRRPLLETMGALEGGWGFQTSLKQACALGWPTNYGDTRKAYHIEDAAASLRDMMDKGKLMEKYADERTAWWVIRSKRGLLIAVVSVENGNLLPPEPMNFDYSIYLNESKEMTIIEYDFSEKRGRLHLSADTMIATGPIPYRGFRLYVVT